MLNCVHQQIKEKSMATCYSCGGFKPEGGRCPTCAKIESDERLAEQQRENNRELASQNLNAQVGIALIQNKEAQRKHDEVMKMEELRLKESRKQTQILLEQGLTLEDVYQIGFSFEERGSPSLFESEDPEVIISLNDRGDIVADYENPYVQQKFRQAYQNGVEDRLKKDYSKSPGIEFMSDAALNNGYLRSEYCTIFFPNKSDSRFSFKAERQPEFSQSFNLQDGSLELVWINPYDSDFLNQSFEDGVNNYLKEQNTLEKKNQRLATINNVMESELANKNAQKMLDKETADKAASRKFWNVASKAFGGALYGGFIGFLIGFAMYYIVGYSAILFGGMYMTFWEFMKFPIFISAFIGLFVGKEL
jgi:hypothetical protein